MRWMYVFVFAAMLAGTASAQTSPRQLGSAPQATNNCAPGERIDGTTADQAKKKAEAAGFRDVRELKKGCDNVWHGKAIKDAVPVRVAVLPQGEVVVERD